MKKGVIIIMMFLFSCGILSCDEQTTVETGESYLHYILPINEYDNPFIGDVHPFYDEESQTWYMFYLDTSGFFHSRLLTSTNGLNWEPTKIKINSGFQNYGVLNVFKKDSKYYSYYAEFQPSVSEDLINWSYAGGEYKISQDSQTFPLGMRDPDVVYDSETDRFYSVSLNYFTNTSGERAANLAVGASVGNNQTDWLPTHKPVRTIGTVNSDYECPQLVKIGDRWYIFSSRYGQSVHGVGRLSYFIGDIGKNPYEVDWVNKEEHFLTTEDLAAAQVEEANGKFYVYGWIPRYHNGGFWGGFINLPTEVYAFTDGTLATKLADTISEAIRGELIDSNNTDIQISKSQSVSLDISERFDLETNFTMNSGLMEISFSNNNLKILIDDTLDGQMVTIMTGNYVTAQMDLRDNALKSLNTIRIIGEGKTVEVFLNDKYSIVSRIEENFRDGKIKFSMNTGESLISNLESFRLKYREEVR